MSEDLPQKPRSKLNQAIKLPPLGDSYRESPKQTSNVNVHERTFLLQPENISIGPNHTNAETSSIDTAIQAWEESITELRRTIRVAEERMAMDDDSFNEMFGALAEHFRERIPSLIKEDQERITELEALTLALKRKRIGLTE
ncbi:MAG: hypothetical protein JWL75_271 [Parcubacteria group bacterium]|nr:hypothetical protein [Parcubacteria group bacterium]